MTETTKILAPNISYLDYMNMEDKSEYNYYLRYYEGEGVDHFNIGEFIGKKFGFVKSTQFTLNNEGLKWDIFFTLIEKQTGKKLKELVKYPLFHLQQQRIFIKEQIELINKIESENLGHTSSPEEEAAGLQDFKIFAHYPQVRNIMILFHWTQEYVEDLSYDWVFTELKYQATMSQFQSNLSKIRRK